MTDDEFREYKIVIQGAADLVKFDSRLDIQLQQIAGYPDVIVITSQRNHDASIILAPEKHTFYLGWTEDNKWTPVEINLAIPDSLQTFGGIIKRILGPSWAKSK